MPNKATLILDSKTILQDGRLIQRKIGNLPNQIQVTNTVLSTACIVETQASPSCGTTTKLAKATTNTLAVPS